MPREGAIIFSDLIGKLDAPYKSGPSKAWLKIKNPKAPAATRAADGTF
jgi:ATP-dependent DNA ligase